MYHKRGSTRERYKDVVNDEKYSFDNVITTVNKHATHFQKAIFILLMLKTATLSMMGKAIGRNKIGGIPYFKIIRASAIL